MKLKEAQNRQANILDKLDILNRTLKEAVDLGMVIDVNMKTWTQGLLNDRNPKEYTSLEVFVGIRPSDVEL